MVKSVLRIKKYATLNSIINVGNHNSRTHQPDNANPDLSHQNVLLIGSNDWKSDVVAKLDTLTTKPRKDAVQCVEMVLSASPDFYKNSAGEIDLDFAKEWAAKSIKMLSQKYPGLISNATLHLDESTPHVHLFIVPIVEREQKCPGKATSSGERKTKQVRTLSCKSIFGGSSKNEAAEKLSELQDDYEKFLRNSFPEKNIEQRTVRHSDIKDGSFHVPTKVYLAQEKQAISQEKQSLFQEKRSIEKSKIIIGMKEADLKKQTEEKIQELDRKDREYNDRNAKKTYAERFLYDRIKHNHVAIVENPNKTLNLAYTDSCPSSDKIKIAEAAKFITQETLKSWEFIFSSIKNIIKARKNNQMHEKKLEEIQLQMQKQQEESAKLLGKAKSEYEELLKKTTSLKGLDKATATEIAKDMMKLNIRPNRKPTAPEK